MPTTDLFIKTCSHDRDYHEHCLASIEKFCTGFRNVVVIDGEHPQGYLHQQIVKLYADTYTDADFILITDSDTLFTRPVTPETYFRDGKIEWIHTPFTEELKAAVPWFNVMAEFARSAPPSEFMRRQPFMLPAWLLRELRQWCEFSHGITLDKYVMNAGRFSEFNILGHYAWKFHQGRFHWIDSSKDELPELTVRQFWSHDPIASNIEEIGRILA